MLVFIRELLHPHPSSPSIPFAARRKHSRFCSLFTSFLGGPVIIFYLLIALVSVVPWVLLAVSFPWVLSRDSSLSNGSMCRTRGKSSFLWHCEFLIKC